MRRFLPVGGGALAAAFVLAGCGTGGLAAKGDRDAGKKLFANKCASCHTLAAAGSQGTLGPNLDDAFAEARKEGYKESSIRQIVHDQIRYPGQYPAKGGQNFLQANMPANLVTGKDAEDVATFVAANAGLSGFGQQAAVTGTNGKAIFKSSCGSCHTLADARTTGKIGPNLDQLKPDLARVKRQVIQGGSLMPAFKGRLTDAQIAAVAKYVASVAGK